MARIQILSGPDSGKVVELGQGKHLVGRMPTVDLSIPSDTISGKHLELEILADEKVKFKDLGSTNGTWAGGMKVTEGEWFLGSELRLGNVRLKLLDTHEVPTSPGGGDGDIVIEEEASQDVDTGDAEIHRRALEQAMSGRRKGGPLLMVLLLLVVAGAGGAYYFLGGEQSSDSSGGNRVGSGGATAAVDSDLIEGLGNFQEEAAASWSLASGLSIEGNALRAADANHRFATLGSWFAMEDAAVEITANVSGNLEVWPLLSWAADESGDEEEGSQRAVLGEWSGASLKNGAVRIPLPENAAWFRLSLECAGTGSLSDLKVEASEAELPLQSHDGRSYLTHGGNLAINGRSAGPPVLVIRGVGGTWKTTAGGFDFVSEGGDGWCAVMPGRNLRQSGPFYLLGEGGPSEFNVGVRVQDSPGMLIGGEGMRLDLRIAPATNILATHHGALATQIRELSLRWDLSASLSRASTLHLEIRNAAQEGRSGFVLTGTAEMLREWPLQENQLEEVSRLRREVMTQGREDLNTLLVEVSEALFLESIPDLQRVELEARALAERLPGTDIARQADDAADLLNANAERISAAKAQKEQNYQRRLQNALSGAYPLIAAFLERNS